jgi:hypothetical protein
MFAMTERVEVIKRWIDGPDFLTWFELYTASAGPLGNRQLEPHRGRPNQANQSHLRFASGALNGGGGAAYTTQPQRPRGA